MSPRKRITDALVDSERERSEAPKTVEKRRTLSEEEIKALEEKEESEIAATKGSIGPKDYYTAPNPLVYMPRTANTDALVHDMETQRSIEEALSEVKGLRKQMETDATEIDRLKAETRIIIAKLLTV
jgi:hypothetical protein